MPDADSLLELTPSFQSRPIKVKAIANQPFTLKHELNRIPAGWIIIDTNTNVNVWRQGQMNKHIIDLIADQDADISLVLL